MEKIFPLEGRTRLSDYIIQLSRPQYQFCPFGCQILLYIYLEVNPNAAALLSTMNSARGIWRQISVITALVPLPLREINKGSLCRSTWNVPEWARNLYAEKGSRQPFFIPWIVTECRVLFWTKNTGLNLENRIFVIKLYFASKSFLLLLGILLV
jgi:hypothetical protein